VSALRDRRLDDEIRHHIEERADRLVAQGMVPDDARREAERVFGDVQAVRAELERIEEPQRGALRTLADRLRQDVTFAARQMRRAPGFTAVAILTLAIGIGAATSIFGLVKAVVLDPLPYPQSDRIVVVNEETPDGMRFSVAGPNFEDFAERIRSLEHLSAISRADLTYLADGRPSNVVAAQVTGSFFPLFGATPTLGRTFTDDESGHAARALAVVSESFWRDRLSSDPDVLGRSLVLDDVPYEVVGVAQAGWSPVMDRTDVWLPISLEEGDRSDHDLDVLGRVAPGATLASALADARTVAAELAREHPLTNGGWSVRLRTLKEALLGPARVRAGWVLLGAVGLLLLLACASVSNLLLARAGGRGREMELRVALGADRRRLVQQLVTESLLLAGLGALVGIVLAVLLLPLLQHVAPADTPRLAAASIDGSVAAAATLTALVTGLVFGLAPVLHVLRGARGGAARGTARVAGASSERLRTALVAAQVAVSLCLLFGTGALGASFLRLQRVDSGMDVDHTLVVPLMLSGDRYTPEQRAVALAALHDQLSSLPGVEAVGSTNIRPFSGANSMINLNVQGRAITAESAPWARWRAVSPTWFAAAGVGLLQGRLLEPADDDPNAEPVLVVTRTLARRLFGSAEAAVGRNVAFSWDGTNWRRIVGVVSDVEDLELASSPPATLFLPAGGYMSWAIFLVRFRPDAPLAAAREVRRAVWAADDGLPVPSVERLSDRIGGSVASDRFNLLVMGLFGAVALVLSVMAIYGLVLFSVRRRTREIGVRLALGARSVEVVGLVFRRGMVIAAVGVTAGSLLALRLSRYLDELLFGEAGSRLPLLVAAALTVAVTTAVATWLPARRATRVAPRDALTSE